MCKVRVTTLTAIVHACAALLCAGGGSDLGIHGDSGESERLSSGRETGGGAFLSDRPKNTPLATLVFLLIALSIQAIADRDVRLRAQGVYQCLPPAAQQTFRPSSSIASGPSCSTLFAILRFESKD
jgi:hypothetical protein